MQEKTQFTLEDLRNLLQLVEVATSRGAFRAAELSSVGQAYDKASAYVESLASSVQQEAASRQQYEETQIEEEA